MGIEEMKSEGDVLDLCVRKQDKEDEKEKFGGDVNGNGFYGGYGDVKNGFRCRSPQELLQPRFVQPLTARPEPDSSPNAVLRERMCHEGKNRDPQ